MAKVSIIKNNTVNRIFCWVDVLLAVAALISKSTPPFSTTECLVNHYLSLANFNTNLNLDTSQITVVWISYGENCPQVTEVRTSGLKVDILNIIVLYEVIVQTRFSLC